MSAQHFFITGLPRSRTSWLANFFTWEQSLCFHDGLHRCDSVTAFKEKMAAAGTSLSQIRRENQVFVGNSDSGLVLCWPRLLKLFPDAKWIIVLRNTDEAARCFVKFFSAYPYIGQPPPNLADTLELFDYARNELVSLGQAIPEGQARVVDMSLLDSLEEIEAIWNFLFDGAITFPVARWALIKDLMINPMSPRITMDVEAWTSLLRSGTEPLRPSRERVPA